MKFWSLSQNLHAWNSTVTLLKRWKKNFCFYFQAFSNLQCLSLLIFSFPWSFHVKFPLHQIPINGFEAIMRLQILDLSACVGSLPDTAAFTSLPQLQELYLRSFIIWIPLSECPFASCSFRDLLKVKLTSHLHFLICERCGLNRRVQLHEVPSDILTLRKLQILDLSQNSLTSIPEVIICLLERICELMSYDIPGDFLFPLSFSFRKPLKVFWDNSITFPYCLF